MRPQKQRPQKQKTYHQRKHFVKTDSKPKSLTFDQLLRNFKKKVERSGILQEVKEREYYEKPSMKRRLKKKEAIRKQKLRQEAEQQGLHNRQY